MALSVVALALAGCANKDLAADDGSIVVEVEDTSDDALNKLGNSRALSEKRRTRKVKLSVEEREELARRGNSPNFVQRTQARANYCPKLEVLNGTGVLTAYINGGNDTASDITHQATITRSGRECSRADGALTFRIGTAGRAVKGPKSVSDNVTLPIRIAVLRNDSEVLFSQLYNQPITFTGATAQGFSFIEESISIPIPEQENIKILVGFDTKQGPVASSSTDAGDQG